MIFSLQVVPFLVTLCIERLKNDPEKIKTIFLLYKPNDVLVIVLGLCLFHYFTEKSLSVSVFNSFDSDSWCKSREDMMPPKWVQFPDSLGNY